MIDYGDLITCEEFDAVPLDGMPPAEVLGRLWAHYEWTLGPDCGKSPDERPRDAIVTAERRRGSRGSVYRKTELVAVLDEIPARLTPEEQCQWMLGFHKERLLLERIGRERYQRMVEANRSFGVDA